MPELVPDQRVAFNSNELFRKLCHDSEVRYIGCRDLTEEERRVRFHANCKSGRAEIAFVNSGTNFFLQFFPWNMDNIEGIAPPPDYVDFDREPGKVYLKAPFILNGVCVRWKGWISLIHLNGMACIEFDEERASIEMSKQPCTSGFQLNNKLFEKKFPIQKHRSLHEVTSQLAKRPRLK